MIQAHPRPVRVLCAVAGSAAAGYLWAAAFGEGIAGLKTGAALDRSDTFPDANAALLIAVLSYAMSALVAVFAAGSTDPRDWARWLVATGLIGGGLFGLSALFS